MRIAPVHAGEIEYQRPTHADGMHMPNFTNSFATRAAHACASSRPATDATPACGLRSAFSSAGIAPMTEFQSGKFYSISV
jgi:hypothetical protein